MMVIITHHNSFLAAREEQGSKRSKHGRRRSENKTKYETFVAIGGAYDVMLMFSTSLFFFFTFISAFHHNNPGEITGFDRQTYANRTITREMNITVRLTDSRQPDNTIKSVSVWCRCLAWSHRPRRDVLHIDVDEVAPSLSSSPTHRFVCAAFSVWRYARYTFT